MVSPFQRPGGGSRPFEAKFPGICEECGEGFEKGDLIRYDGDDLMHADGDDCTRATWTHEQAHPKPCARCLLVHAGECF